MPTLTPEGWTRLRAEWEIGLTSTRALAARHGISEKAIRKRAADRREPWRRDPEAERRARAAAQTATLQGLARSRSAHEVRADPHRLDELREAAVSGAADALADANIRHLAMAAELRAKFDALSQAVTHSLAGGEAAGPARLVGTARSLLLLARVALAIQKIERTALDLGDTLGIAQFEPRLAGAAEVTCRVEDLSTEELSALKKLAALADRASHRSGHAPADSGDRFPLLSACPG